MALSTTIQLDAAQSARLKQILGDLGAAKAVRAALKRLLAKSRGPSTAAGRMATKILTRLMIDRKGALGDNSRPALAHWTDSGGLSGRLIVKDRPIRLTKFKNVKPKNIRVVRKGVNKGGRAPGGVTVQFQKGRAPLVFRHAFLGMATFKKKGEPEGKTLQAFFRTRHISKGGKGKLTPEGYAGRLAVKAIYGPSVRTMMGDVALSDLGREVTMDLMARFRELVQGQIDRQLRQGKAERTEATTL